MPRLPSIKTPTPSLAVYLPAHPFHASRGGSNTTLSLCRHKHAAQSFLQMHLFGASTEGAHATPPIHQKPHSAPNHLPTGAPIR